MPETTQNKLLITVTYGNFQAYCFRRKERERQRVKGPGRKKEERKKRIREKDKRTQPVIQTHRNSDMHMLLKICLCISFTKSSHAFQVVKVTSCFIIKPNTSL